MQNKNFADSSGGVGVNDSRLLAGRSRDIVGTAKGKSKNTQVENAHNVVSRQSRGTVRRDAQRLSPVCDLCRPETVASPIKGKRQVLLDLAKNDYHRVRFQDSPKMTASISFFPRTQTGSARLFGKEIFEILSSNRRCAYLSVFTGNGTGLGVQAASRGASLHYERRFGF